MRQGYKDGAPERDRCLLATPQLPSSASNEGPQALGMLLAPSPASELRYSHGQPSSAAAQPHLRTWAGRGRARPPGRVRGTAAAPRAAPRAPPGAAPPAPCGGSGAARGGSGGGPRRPPRHPGVPPVSPPARTHSRAAPSTPRAAASAASPAPARMAPAPAPPQPGAERPPPGSPLPVLPPPQNCREAAGPRNIQNDLLKSNLKQKSSSRSVECR